MSAVAAAAATAAMIKLDGVPPPHAAMSYSSAHISSTLICYRLFTCTETGKWTAAQLVAMSFMDSHMQRDGQTSPFAITPTAVTASTM